MAAAAPGPVTSRLLAHGETSLPPLSTSSFLRQWDFDITLTAGLVVVTAAYLLAVRKLARRGDSWPIGRSLAFCGGIATIAVATMTWIGAYDVTLFWVHAVQHMLLAMVAPVFFALGAPVTLALRVLPVRPRRQLLRLLHSLPARVLASPLVSLPLFMVTLVSLYFSGWYEATLRSEYLHEMQHIHFLLTGCLFFWPLFGIDPLPGRLPYIARLFAIIMTLPVHIIVGLSLMMSTEIVAEDYYRSLDRQWGPSLARDQYTGGGIIWGTGDIVGLLYVAVLCSQWIRSDEREARRRDRTDDRLRAAGQSERTELATYNAYLAMLNGVPRTKAGEIVAPMPSSDEVPTCMQADEAPAFGDNQGPEVARGDAGGGMRAKAGW